jgi:CDP-alcohol phosphatidyltransferase
MVMLRAVAGSPDSDSRAATNDLLRGLRTGRWHPPAWGRFLRRAGLRSWEQARAHPRALAEVIALHATLAVLGCRHRWRWAVASWALAVTHLGMLESRRSLGVANVLTLTRANLPVSATGDGRVLGLLALISDLADGRLARRLGTVTPFGRDADSIADAAFWTCPGLSAGVGLTLCACSPRWLRLGRDRTAT